MNLFSKDPEILVMDDEWDTVKGLVSELHLIRGIACDSARSESEARDKLRRNRYRLLIVDMRWEWPDQEIQEAGGLGLILDLAKGRLGPLNQHIPYVLISAQAFLHHTLVAGIPDAGDIALLQKRRRAVFEKGERITGQADRIETILRQLEPGDAR